MDAAYRAPLPYLVFIAASFGAGTTGAGWLAVSWNLAGLAAPIVGIVEGRMGRRAMVIAAAGAFILLCFLMPFAPTFAAVLALYFALGISRALFGPPVQAFVGDNVPYAQRGTVMGIVELSWALGWIVGVPVFGVLLEYAVWWLSFLLFGAVALAGLGLVLRYAVVRNAQQSQPLPAANLFDWSSVRVVWSNATAVRLLIYGMLISFAAQIATLAYAPWLIQQFGLSAAALGLISIVLGVADVVAELATIVLVDRIGKRRSVLIASGTFAASLVLVLALAEELGPLMAGLFVVFLSFEFALVASLAVTSEAVPNARATMSGFVLATHSFGRIVASLVALPLFGFGGLPVVLGISAAASAVSVAVAWPVRVGTHIRADRVEPGGAPAA
jgi:predicted MFS family arabinose efflux permease